MEKENATARFVAAREVQRKVARCQPALDEGGHHPGQLTSGFSLTMFWNSVNRCSGPSDEPSTAVLLRWIAHLSVRWHRDWAVDRDSDALIERRGRNPMAGASEHPAHSTTASNAQLFYESPPVYGAPVYATPTAYASGADRPSPARPPRPTRGPEVIYLTFEGGYQSVALQTLSAKNVLPESVSTSAHGAYYGGAIGLRFGFLTLGGRVRSAHLDRWNLSTFDGELGARINLNRVEPYFTFAAGYAKLKGDGLAGIRDLRHPRDQRASGFRPRLLRRQIIHAGCQLRR